MERRDTLRWMLAAASAPAWGLPRPPRGAGYGTDPDLLAVHRAGALWPLTFTPAQRRTTTALCELLIPADERSPGAAQLGVQDFVDEWISAPYPEHVRDRTLVVDGLAWLDAESARRHGRPFAEADEAGQRAICDDICWLEAAKPEFASAARFFARLRDLVAGGFYTTPEGMKDLQFAGNVASATFDGPPAAVLRIVGVNA